ncbi:hypothetical protein HAZT_HAZT000555 [Hyalella azteca]|uniref:Carboxylesterase type B domain-containing protein n=1 Tax=Hyalella azteca TaxID=294128 RepID=A0A6A0H6H3_HYAAZ|nr:hypothetical protein HAZT_HAZT000555 [Hyalella azteca]
MQRVGVLALLLSLNYMEVSQGSRHNGHLSPRVIRTKYGTVRGMINSIGVDGMGDAEVFLGLPYAEPPVGNLRLMPPGTPSPWSALRVAQHLGPVCPQRLPDIRNKTEALKTMSQGRYHHLRRLLPYLRNQSEDCLYLNIYSPAGVVGMHKEILMENIAVSDAA